MKVPEYKQKSTYQGRNTAAYIQSGDFGRVAHAMSANTTGKQLERLGNTISNIGEYTAKRFDNKQTANVNEGIVKLQNSYTEWQTNQKQKQGKEALTSVNDYKEWLSANDAEITKDMTEAEQGRFYGNASTMVAEQKNWADEYEFTQEQAYLDTNYRASLDNTFNQIENGSMSYQVGIEHITKLVSGKNVSNGLSLEETRADFRKELTTGLTRLTNNFINEGKLGDASVLVKKLKTDMNPDEYAALENRIKVKQEVQFLQNNKNLELAKQKTFNNNMNNRFLAIVNNTKGFIEAEDRELAIRQSIDLEKDAFVKEELQNRFEPEIKQMRTLDSATKAQIMVRLSNTLAEEKKSAHESRTHLNGLLAEEKISSSHHQVGIDFLNGKRSETTPENKAKTNKIMIAIDDGLLTTVDQVYAKAFDDGLTIPQMKEAGKYFNEGNTDEKITYSDVNRVFKALTGKITKKSQNDSDADELISSKLNGSELNSNNLSQTVATPHELIPSDLNQNDLSSSDLDSNDLDSSDLSQEDYQYIKKQAKRSGVSSDADLRTLFADSGIVKTDKASQYEQKLTIEETLTNDFNAENEYNQIFEAWKQEQKEKEKEGEKQVLDLGHLTSEQKEMLMANVNTIPQISHHNDSTELNYDEILRENENKRGIEKATKIKETLARNKSFANDFHAENAEIQRFEEWKQRKREEKNIQKQVLDLANLSPEELESWNRDNSFYVDEPASQTVIEFEQFIDSNDDTRKKYASIPFARDKVNAVKKDFPILSSVLENEFTHTELTRLKEAHRVHAQNSLLTGTKEIPLPSRDRWVVKERDLDAMTIFGKSIGFTNPIQSRLNWGLIHQLFENEDASQNIGFNNGVYEGRVGEDRSLKPYRVNKEYDGVILHDTYLNSAIGMLREKYGQGDYSLPWNNCQDFIEDVIKLGDEIASLHGDSIYLDTVK